MNVDVTRIFIVEDEALIAMETRDRLTRLGYSVCGVAARGETAVEQIMAVQPHLVLMDINLAGEMNGIDTVAQLREVSDIPVLYLTAYSDDDLLRRALETGPFGYLVKPYEERELHTTIQSALAKHRAMVAVQEKNKQLDDTLQTAREEADVANRAKSEFLSSMSHELRTPLNAVLGFAQLIESEVAPEHTQAVRHIVTSGEHLLSMVNQVLDFSRTEASNLALNSEVGPVRYDIEECLLIIEPLAKEKGVEIVPYLDDLEAISVQVDRMRFKQVLLVLLSNAIKYNDTGGDVSCRYATDAEGVVRLIVEDSGRGIDAEHQTQVFQPFNRLGAESSEVEGLGIGLVLSKRIVEAMGGQIGFESEPGKGSTFWFTVPLASVSLPSLTERVDIPPEGAGKPPPRVEDDRKTVLYVEDNPDNLALMAAILKRGRDLDMVSATSGRAGLERAREEAPDIILLDIQLADMDGFGLLEALRAEPKFAETPILAVSAAARPSDIERGNLAGFQAYLTKPLNVNLVLETISRFVH